MEDKERQLLKEFQISWSKKKYWVMSRSQQAYNQIRFLAKGNEWSSEKQKQYEKILIDLEQIKPTDKTLRVAYQHVWGYFKKVATEVEKQRYIKLIDEIPLDSHQLEDFLKALSLKYNQAYLLQIKWIMVDEIETE